MGTKVERVLPCNRWKDGPIMVKQFFGGEKGKMLQVTKRNNDGEIGYIQLTKPEAVRLAHRMIEWAMECAAIGDDLEE